MHSIYYDKFPKSVGTLDNPVAQVTGVKQTINQETVSFNVKASHTPKYIMALVLLVHTQKREGEKGGGTDLSNALVPKYVPIS